MTKNAELPEGADDTVAAKERDAERYTKRGKLRGSVYEAEMERLQSSSSSSSTGSRARA